MKIETVRKGDRFERLRRLLRVEKIEAQKITKMVRLSKSGDAFVRQMEMQ